jgi:hypothetical protein
MKQVIALMAFIFSLSMGYSQSTISFCARVDQNGYCLFNNTKFFLSPDSTTETIYLEVKQPATFTGTAKITFKFYTVDKNGEEKYSSMAEQNVQDSWMFAWLPHQFNAGKYNIKIYNDKNELLASRSLELFN